MKYDATRWDIATLAPEGLWREWMRALEEIRDLPEATPWRPQLST